MSRSLVSHQEFSIRNAGAILTTPFSGTHERHESFYDWDFITRYLENNARPDPPREFVTAQLVFTSMLADFSRRALWGAEIKQNPPTVTYGEVMGSEGGVAKMTGLIV